MKITLHNQLLGIKEFISIARNQETFSLSSEVKSKVLSTRNAIEQAIAEGKIMYGISTGFGAFKNKVIQKEDAEKLQENLIVSHSVGVGDHFSTEVVRGIMLLMVNYLSKGFSGIRWETIDTLVQMLNKKVHPLVPEKGSVGSSGDLAPSAHVALVLIGKGEAEFHGKIMSGAQAMKKAGIKPVTLSFKEGLAIINNTSTMTSIAALLLHDVDWLTKIATIAASLSLQALRGTDRAYDEKIHLLKPHAGQVKTAKELQKLLSKSTFIDRQRIQEAYSFRCVPQIHGAILEAVSYVNTVVSTEMNSVTDNPLIFIKNGTEVISGGNFHGESVAIAMDTLGIALSELGNVSERRIAALTDPANSNGLPAFLVENGGLNSGFMIVQYTAAALVSENKVLSHPASVDSIPTSANVEDLVSMGTIAARKAREIFGNSAMVLTLEIITACQAIDLRIKISTDKPKLSPVTQKIYDQVRRIIPYFPHDTEYYPYFSKLRNSLEDITQSQQ